MNNDKKFATLQTQFKWKELTGEQQIEIVKQFKNNIRLTKYCNEYSQAIFMKDGKGKWLIKNILLLNQ